MNNDLKRYITVVVAMSGGVDSSVAAALLKKEEYNIIGITMKVWNYSDISKKESGCCSLDSIYNAQNIAHYLGFNHYTYDFTEKFNDTVIENFLSEYLKGRTPNPCILCNKIIKWGLLLENAESLGADYIATGHYAKVNFDKSSNRYYISVSEDKNKDQSYALWNLSQDALKRTILPLGHYNKTQIREIARELNLKTADTPDSQEICFVPDNDYRKLFKIKIPEIGEKINKGDIIYRGKVIGQHNGYINYTIGQRRGIGISTGKPLYVSVIDAENNIIYVDEEPGLYHKSLIVSNINMMKTVKITDQKKTKVKIRYKDEGSFALIEQTDDNTIKIIFDKPKKSITPGQSAVFYEDDDVIGGGIIEKVCD